jgi:hypothetical protein
MKRPMSDGGGTPERGEGGHLAQDNPTNRTIYQLLVASSDGKGPITRSTTWTKQSGIDSVKKQEK